MSTPPPGYSGESILQTHGGTAEILPVMGGGRVKKALHNIRKKHSRKPATKQRNKATKKNKRNKTQEGGNSNHYTLTELEGYKLNKAMNIRSATINKVIIPKEKTNLPIVERDISAYLKNQAKLWVRKLNTSVLLRSDLKPKIPTTDNIGCTFGLQTINRIVRYAPDRLCCVLSKDTTCITLFPAVNGDVNTFLRIATYMNAEPADAKNRVYIFSPPFLGVNLENNKQVFDYFLYYKNTVSNSTNLWSFYILTEYSTQNVEAAKALSLATRPNAVITDELKKYVAQETSTNNTHPDATLITSIYSMLEPTYIIYPYNLTFPTASVSRVIAEVGKISREEYTTQIRVFEEKRAAAGAALTEATKLVEKAKSEHREAASEAWSASQSLTRANSAVRTPQAEIDTLDNDIKADALALTNMGTGVTGTPEYTRANSALEAKKVELVAKKEKIIELTRAYTSAENRYTEKEKEAEEKKIAIKTAEAAERSAKAQDTKAKNSYTEAESKLKDFIDPGAASTTAIPEQKGGLLFSAATKNEAILPAPYSGFDAAIKYIQTNDAQSKRGSIAYRAVMSKREPILDSMDYEEYNLLYAPPMNDHTIFSFTLNIPSPDDVGRAETSNDLSAFVGSPTIVQNHVPDVAVSVGPQEYSIRSPVPDVINDWNNGLFSTDEANYLNAMKLSPKILQGAFPGGWKKPLSDHLSMITRSNCFRDNRLLLHADCQQAQGFVSRVLEYFMTHTNDILSMQKKQGDSYTKQIETRFNALAKTLAFENGIAGKDIFDPVAFIETFFPKLNSDGKQGVPGIDYLVSVNSIKVDTKRTTFIVSYLKEDTLVASALQIVGRQLQVPDTFTETPGTQENEYTWTFKNAQSEQEVLFITRRFIRSFTIIGEYDSDIRSNTFIVVYKGKISEMDKKLLEKKLGGTYTENPQKLLHMYEWTIPVEKTEKELQEIFDSIKNENKYNFTLEPNPTANADDVTAVVPNKDLAENRIIKVFSMALSSNPAKAIYADFSMDSPPETSAGEAITILEDTYVKIAKKINGRPPEPLVFGGRYTFYINYE